MRYITPRKIRTPEEDQMAYAEYLSDEAKTKKNLGPDALEAINMIKTGPPIIEYWRKTHEIWVNMLWLRYSCRKPQEAPPPDPVTPLVTFIKRIRQECTATPINPATRANGLYTLAQICYWNDQALYHESEPLFWKHPQVGAESYVLENAMKAIIDSMSPGARKLIANSLCRDNLKDIFDCLQDLLDSEKPSPPPKIQEAVEALRRSWKINESHESGDGTDQRQI